MANDFSGDANCVALWRLEDGALTTDSKGTNTLTNSGVTSDQVNYKEGAASGAFVKNDSDHLFIDDTNLDSGFPLKSGEANKSFSICFWERRTDGGELSIINKHDHAGTDESLDIWDDTSVGIALGISEHGNDVVHYKHASLIGINKQYHIGITYDNSNYSYRIRIWDDDAGEILGVDKTGTATDINISDHPLCIGLLNKAVAPFGGNLDEIVIFDRALTVAQIDAISAQTYPYMHLASTSAIVTATSGALSIVKNLASTSAAVSATSGAMSIVKNLVSTSVVTTAASSHLIAVVSVAGSSNSVTATSAALTPIRGIASTSAAVSATSGAMSIVKNLVSTSACVTATSSALSIVKNLTSTSACVTATSAAMTDVNFLVSTSAITTSTSAALTPIRGIASTSAAATATSGALSIVKNLVSTSAIATATSGALSIVKNFVSTSVVVTVAAGHIVAVVDVVGSSAIVTTVTGKLYEEWDEMPPLVLAHLEDPYRGGAWLWLVQIAIPDCETINLARNTVDIMHISVNYTKYNFDIGLAKITADGGVPRTVIKVAQDTARSLEVKINAAEGGYGGSVKILRIHQDYLNYRITPLEQTISILTSNSDAKWVYIVCGIPNPLLQKILQRRYTSKVCPYALPGLFKGPECQYADADVICTGLYDDCYDKSNATKWGGNLGLDPSAVKV